jgi:hypothetical protein
VRIGTNEFFPQLVYLAANERHLQSHPNRHQKLGRRNQSAVSSELTPSRGDPFPPVFVMEAAENRASLDLEVLGRNFVLSRFPRFPSTGELNKYVPASLADGRLMEFLRTTGGRRSGSATAIHFIPEAPPGCFSNFRLPPDVQHPVFASAVARDIIAINKLLQYMRLRHSSAGDFSVALLTEGNTAYGSLSATSSLQPVRPIRSSYRLSTYRSHSISPVFAVNRRKLGENANNHLSKKLHPIPPALCRCPLKTTVGLRRIPSLPFLSWTFPPPNSCSPICLPPSLTNNSTT